MKTVKFELTAEHVKLIGELAFEVCTDAYDDALIPGISRKRPFGNGWAIASVLDLLGCECGGDRKYKEEDTEKARELLIELPVALEIVTQYRTFEPGVYEVSPYGAYARYQAAKARLHGSCQEEKPTIN